MSCINKKKIRVYFELFELFKLEIISPLKNLSGVIDVTDHVRADIVFIKKQNNSSLRQEEPKA